MNLAMLSNFSSSIIFTQFKNVSRIVAVFFQKISKEFPRALWPCNTQVSRPPPNQNVYVTRYCRRNISKDETILKNGDIIRYSS